MRIVCFVGLVAVLLTACFLRNALWQDDAALWLDTLQKSPGKARPYAELGLYRLREGNHEGARWLLAKSIELDPFQPLPVYVNLGLAYEELDQIEPAIRTYELAIQHQPDSPTPYYNLGLLYYKTFNDLDKALLFLLKARDSARRSRMHLSGWSSATVETRTGLRGFMLYQSLK
jgi:tetratricopeptide (TPR) repeat protein